MIDVNQILFHPHYLGEIMTEPHGKSNLERYKDACDNLSRYKVQYSEMKNKDTATAQKKLLQIGKTEAEVKELYLVKDKFEPSETCKKRLVKIFVEAHYGRERNIENKYMTKGLQVEEDAITLYSRIKRTPYYKNELTIRNEFLEGTPDFGSERIITNSSVVIDTKASWDLFTFWNARTSSLYSDYYWQGQGYCDLIPTAKKCVIAYCLVDTPSTLIHDEQNRLKWKMGVINPEADILYQEACEKIEKSMTYGDIPKEEKVFEIEVKRNDDEIERAHNQILNCRQWMKDNLFSKLLEPIKEREAA